MAALWASCREAGAAGVLWQDPDIVMDPHDHEAMVNAITADPGRVYVAAHKLWPASTQADRWVWGFGPMDGQYTKLSRIIPGTIGWFSLGLTWTPAALLDAAAPHMPAWEFGQVDTGLSATARDLHIPVHLVPGAQPKHLHFVPREGDAGWRG